MEEDGGALQLGGKRRDGTRSVTAGRHGSQLLLRGQKPGRCLARKVELLPQSRDALGRKLELVVDVGQSHLTGLELFLSLVQALSEGGQPLLVGTGRGCRCGGAGGGSLRVVDRIEVAEGRRGVPLGRRDGVRGVRTGRCGGGLSPIRCPMQGEEARSAAGG